MLGGHVAVTIFSVSAKLALEAKLAAKPHHPAVGPAAEAWERSRFGALQSYLDSILTDEEKVGGWGRAEGGRRSGAEPRLLPPPINPDSNGRAVLVMRSFRRASR